MLASQSLEQRKQDHSRNENAVDDFWDEGFFRGAGRESRAIPTIDDDGCLICMSFVISRDPEKSSQSQGVWLCETKSLSHANRGYKHLVLFGLHDPLTGPLGFFRHDQLEVGDAERMRKSGKIIHKINPKEGATPYTSVEQALQDWSSST